MAALIESVTSAMPLALAQSHLEAAFASALARLPDHAQAALLSFWRAGGAYDDGRHVPPLVIVEPPGSSLLPSNALAATSGFSFYFLHPLVSAAPDEVLAAVVVHELGHAFLRAHQHEAGTEEREETAARTTVLAWGFDENAVDRWSSENLQLLGIGRSRTTPREGRQ